MTHPVLTDLGLLDTNPGSWIGDQPLSATGNGIESFSPTTGDLLGSVDASSMADYEAIMNAATDAAARWKQIPAPQRGEAIRRVGEALRAHKDALGSLVTLEMGKIKAEGDGEVQEMIDIADFAVGQSRMMYGKTMHSERPQHRQWSRRRNQRNRHDRKVKNPPRIAPEPSKIGDETQDDLGDENAENCGIDPHQPRACHCHRRRRRLCGQNQRVDDDQRHYDRFKPGLGKQCLDTGLHVILRIVSDRCGDRTV